MPLARVLAVSMVVWLCKGSCPLTSMHCIRLLQSVRKLWTQILDKRSSGTVYAKSVCNVFSWLRNVHVVLASWAIDRCTELLVDKNSSSESTFVVCCSAIYTVHTVSGMLTVAFLTG